MRRAATVPVLLDGGVSLVTPEPTDPPPEKDAIPFVDPNLPFRILSGGKSLAFFSINRHNGGVNGLFLDWSVRKVGLKELWTLKWHRQYDTNGPWTIAGGVQAEDWPQWMRGFRDY